MLRLCGLRLYSLSPNRFILSAAGIFLTRHDDKDDAEGYIYEIESPAEVRQAIGVPEEVIHMVITSISVGISRA